MAMEASLPVEFAGQHHQILISMAQKPQTQLEPEVT
jgi:hypothetical protein